MAGLDILVIGSKKASYYRHVDIGFVQSTSESVDLTNVRHVSHSLKARRAFSPPIRYG